MQSTYLASAQLLIIVPFVLVGLGLSLGGFDRSFTVLHAIVVPILLFGYPAWMMATFFSGSRTWSAIRAIAIQLVMLLPYWLIVLAVFRLWTKLTGAGAA